MKINPDTTLILQEYMENPSAYENTEDLIIKCVSLEKNDYATAYSLLKKYNRIEEAVYMDLKSKELVEFEKNSNPIGFINQVRETCSYHKRQTTKNEISDDIRNLFGVNNQITYTIELINKISNFNKTKKWLEQQENQMSAIQNKIEEGTELPDLLCWFNEQENS